MAIVDYCIFLTSNFLFMYISLVTFLCLHTLACLSKKYLWVVYALDQALGLISMANCLYTSSPSYIGTPPSILTVPWQQPQ